MNKRQERDLVVIFLALFLVTCLTACNCHHGFRSAIVVPDQPSAPSTPVQPSSTSTIDSIVDAFNTAQVQQNLPVVTQGLNCSLYSTPWGVTTIVGANLTFLASFVHDGTIDNETGPSSPGINLLPYYLRSNVPVPYVIKCKGYLVVEKDGVQNFDIYVDDGAILSLNGSTVVTADRLGSTAEFSGSASLKAGLVPMELDYLDIGGIHALQLLSNGAIINAENFYH